MPIERIKQHILQAGFLTNMGGRFLKFANDAEPVTETGNVNKNGHNGDVKIKNHGYWLWMLPVINYTVIPCCQMNLTPPVIGNVLNGNTLSEVWSNKKYQEVRKKDTLFKQEINEYGKKRRKTYMQQDNDFNRRLFNEEQWQQ
ncbi:MAG: SPASM domain-containing protein [Nitrospira sp.]|nr:SPASM domain-containing protein [Nitrospira sp.]